MSDSPYRKFHDDELTLRDYLAVDRTVLANERTFLSYVRTALGFAVLGLTFLHFLDDPILQMLGYPFIGVGFVVLWIGVVRFLRTRHELAALWAVKDDP